MLSKLGKLKGSRRPAKLCRRVARVGAGKRGAVLVEAAIVFPILILIFVGMVEFSQAFTARRRVQAVAATAADLVAQNATVTTADLNDIVSAGSQLMTPFSATGLTLRITSVGQDEQNNIVSLWSCSWSSISASPSCTAGGDYTTLPAGLIVSSTDSIIVGQTSYAYTPLFGQFLQDGVTFSGASYFRPRVSQNVAKK
jgi:Flp pilus assembly protein TadG